MGRGEAAHGLLAALGPGGEGTLLPSPQTALRPATGQHTWPHGGQDTCPGHTARQALPGGPDSPGVEGWGSEVQAAGSLLGRHVWRGPEKTGWAYTRVHGRSGTPLFPGPFPLGALPVSQISPPFTLMSPQLMQRWGGLEGAGPHHTGPQQDVEGPQACCWPASPTLSFCSEQPLVTTPPSTSHPGPGSRSRLGAGPGAAQIRSGSGRWRVGVGAATAPVVLSAANCTCPPHWASCTPLS